MYFHMKERRYVWYGIRAESKFELDSNLGPLIKEYADKIYAIAGRCKTLPHFAQPKKANKAEKVFPPH